LFIGRNLNDISNETYKHKIFDWVTSTCLECKSEKLEIKKWPKWACQASPFDWTYVERLAYCLRSR